MACRPSSSRALDARAQGRRRPAAAASRAGRAPATRRAQDDRRASIRPKRRRPRRLDVAIAVASVLYVVGGVALDTPPAATDSALQLAT
jgi:hypothetical protein